MGLPADRRSRRALLSGLGLLALAAVAVAVSLNTGTISLSPAAVWRTLAGGGTAEESLILFQYRLPRILVTMLAGIGLGVAGAVFQGASRNSLADPGLLGINAGAALGLIVFVSFFRTMDGPVSLLIPAFAFIGGTAAAVLVFLLSYERGRGLLPIQLILTGISIEAGLSAMTLFLSLRLDPDTYAFTARWLAGSVWGRDWIHVWTLLPWIAVLVPCIYMASRTLDSFSFGDDLAKGLGSRVGRSRLLLLAAAVALSCASAAMAGGIGFIGLAAPHIARQLAGPRHRHFLPLTALVGLVILVCADTIGRSLFQPSPVPAGVVAAALGGPYFLYLLFRPKK
ncbi:FecCD family ABC transporter permease [Paenibacillus humicus]|uniref:FecCD family ABC transporter permease n=1 Tax=Paenibacillus humicus TaxID=412861 RepID=UPI000FDA8E6B|nr:iron ABC transporter permease [Paenibacillus humicus]